MAKLLVVFAAVIAVVLGGPVPDAFSEGRIVGGSVAADGAFPYQISIRKYASLRHICGGSILDSTTILTAAHCVQGEEPPSLSIFVGTNTVSSGGTKYQVSSIRVHKDFQRWLLINDIAILKLDTPITFTDIVQPIELQTSEVGPGVNAVVSGWGMTDYPGPSSPNALQYLNTKTLSLSDCLLGEGTNLPVKESNVCTLTEKGEGACHGDSGGPLVANNRQIGIVSWGTSCAVGDPDVFTSVAYYGDWIKENSV